MKEKVKSKEEADRSVKKLEAELKILQVKIASNDTATQKKVNFSYLIFVYTCLKL